MATTGDDGPEVSQDEPLETKATTSPSTPFTSDDEASPEKPKSFKFEFMKGMISDLKARIPLYKSDWGKPKSLFTVVNAIFFAFVVQLIPALIFAELMFKTTKGSLAVAETLLSAGIIGVIYVIITGQPLVLLGITGPVAILLGTSYGLADQFDSEYFAFFWWLCIWTAVMHFIAAIFGLVNFVWIITPFSSQIFEFFIAMSFIYESIRDLVEPIHFTSADDKDGERAAHYATLVIGICTFYICWTLHFAETWVYGSRQLRTFLSSYNMAIAVVIVTALSYLPGVAQDKDGHGIERVEVVAPWDWQPSVERPWVTNPLKDIGYAGILGALFPAFMLFLLFFIDHNISSILTQSPKYNLTKPPSYHWDLFCLGVTIIPCGVLGLPPGSGLIPQAPLHTRALATREIREIHGVKREVTVHVEEQRWSAFFQASLMFVALSLFVAISWIPKGCLFGVFCYLGVGAMHGNEVWERITLSLMYAKKRPPIPIVTNVKWSTVQWFTLVQVASASAIFGIAQFAPVGYIFPALVAALVPLRSYIVSRLFSEADLKYLDPAGETTEDYMEEQELYHEAQRRPSVDEADIDAGFSEFRPAGVPHDAEEWEKAHGKDDDEGVEVPFDKPTTGLTQRKKNAGESESNGNGVRVSNLMTGSAQDAV